MEINSLEWHKKNLKTSIDYYEREMLSLEQKKRYCDRLKADNDKLQKQIERAERENKTYFNANRFKVKEDKSEVIQ